MFNIIHSPLWDCWIATNLYTGDEYFCDTLKEARFIASVLAAPAKEGLLCLH